VIALECKERASCFQAAKRRLPLMTEDASTTDLRSSAAMLRRTSRDID
jgi:hypothetical protein